VHDYACDPQSGAGNCTCGHTHYEVVHPHPFTAAYYNPLVCVCGLGAEGTPHLHRRRFDQCAF
jgi:hypothetical protein